MRKHKANGFRTIVTAVLVLAILGYVGYQAYRSIYSDVTTELAVSHSVFESIETEGLVYRSETVIPAVKSGEPYYTIENGTRVAKNSVIASVYANADSGRIDQQIEEIDNQIAAFRTIMADAGSGRLSLSMINEQSKKVLLDLVHNSDAGLLNDIDGYSFDILSLISKKTLVTGNEVDFSAKIKELEQTKAKLKQTYQKPISKVSAPVAGYFADRVDGLEGELGVDGLSKLTTDALAAQMALQTQSDISACGKIVSGYEWYMACIVPDTYYNVLGVGRTLTVRMSFVLDESIPVTVYACNKDNKGNMAVVFRCDQMSAELSTIRKEAVEIQLVEHSGLKVPKQAIVVDENQQVGVYIRSGNVVAFRKIEQMYSQPADYVVCRVVNEDGYLEMYDDIIVNGRDLYDGKIIH